MTSFHLNQFQTCKISSGSEGSRSGDSLLRLATPPHAFPALNVQLAKQPTASADPLPPRSHACEGLPLKTLIRKICLGGSRRWLGGPRRV
ncbi:unnamed protein product [Prunus armeniaca]